MPVFNFNQTIEHIPAVWRNTNGRGVKLAVLDSGCDLNHPALNHLDLPGHKFDVSRSDFDDTIIPGSGNDDVTDHRPFGTPHGTQVTSIIAGQLQSAHGLKGIAEESEVFIIKISSNQKTFLIQHFIRALKVALALKVDIISMSSIPFVGNSIIPPELTQLFDQIAAAKILVVLTTVNTGLLKRLNNLLYPSNKPQVIVSGLCQKNLINKLKDTDYFNPKINFLMPQFRLKVGHKAGGEPYLNTENTSSYTAAILSGILALCISQERLAQPNFKMTPTEAVAKINNIALPFSKSAMRLLPYRLFTSQ